MRLRMAISVITSFCLSGLALAQQGLPFATSGGSQPVQTYPELRSIMQASGETGLAPANVVPPAVLPSHLPALPAIAPISLPSALPDIPSIPPLVASHQVMTTVREAPQAPRQEAFIPPIAEAAPEHEQMHAAQFDSNQFADCVDWNDQCHAPCDGSDGCLGSACFATACDSSTGMATACQGCRCGCCGFGGTPGCGTDPNGRFLPYAFLAARGTNDRGIGSGGFFVPLWQQTDRFLFADLRGEVDDDSAGEGNFGLGYRMFLDPNWIFGAYLYYDLLASTHDNFFHQGTIGVELLSLDWELRINGHFPGSGDENTNVVNDVSNGTIITRGSLERAYAGFDAEVGKRLLHWGWNDSWQVHWFLGGYYFDHRAHGFESFGGPRTRLELRIYDLAWLGDQSRIEMGIEASYDRIRDDQIGGFVRLRLPLSPKQGRPKLDPLRRRMVDLPMRDIE